MKEKVFKFIREYSLITLGVAIIALGLQSFYLPNNIAAGGLTGLALVINNYIPALSVSTINFFGNGLLIIGAFAIIDRDFGFKTIYASSMLSLFLELFSTILNGKAITNNLLFAVLGGATILSFGLFLLIINNASTGGTEILAKILSKFSTINIPIALLCADLFVTVCGGITFGIEKGIIALMAVTFTGVVLSNIIKLKNKIILNKYPCENLNDIGQCAGVN